MEKDRAESDTPSPWAVHCHGVDPSVGAGPCEPWPGVVYMTHEFYVAQMADADYGWRCPRCFGPASFDDANYENWLPGSQQ